MKNKIILFFSGIILILFFGSYCLSSTSNSNSIEKQLYQMENCMHFADWNRMKTLSEDFIKNYPEMRDGYFFQGMALSELGNYKDAIKYYTKAIEINPTTYDGYQNRAMAYYWNGQYDEAITDCDKALKINPNEEYLIAQREIALKAKNGKITKYAENVETIPEYVLQTFKKMSAKQKEQFAEDIINYPDKVLPLYYVSIADDIFEINKRKAVFLFMVGRFRSVQDVMMCKDETARSAISVFPYMASRTTDYIEKMSNKKLALILQDVLDWDKSHTKRPSPEWICYHGMQALEDGTVQTLPTKDFQNILKQTRTDLEKQINKLKEN